MTYLGFIEWRHEAFARIKFISTPSPALFAMVWPPLPPFLGLPLYLRISDPLRWVYFTRTLRLRKFMPVSNLALAIHRLEKRLDNPRFIFLIYIILSSAHPK